MGGFKPRPKVVEACVAEPSASQATGLHIPSEMPTRQDLESSISRRRSHGNQNL